MELNRTASPRSLQKFKLNSSPNKRPDSMKIELITIPENAGVSAFNPLRSNQESVVSVGFRDISCTVKVGFFGRSK